MVAIRLASSSSTSSRLLLSRDIPATGIGLGSTVTSHLAVLLPSVVMTVIEAAPALTAVTLPSSSTVATSGLEEDQLTDLLVAVDGETVTESVSLSPSTRVIVVLLMDTLSTGMIAGSSSLQPAAEKTEMTDKTKTRVFRGEFFIKIIILSTHNPNNR